VTPQKETASCNAHPQLWPIRLPMSVIATGLRAVSSRIIPQERICQWSLVLRVCLSTNYLSASGTSRLGENDKQTHLYHLCYILEREM